MSIPKEPDKIKTTESLVTTETVSFGPNGHIEDKSVLARYFWAICLILVSLLSFGVGRLSKVGVGGEIKFTYDPSLSALMQSQKSEKQTKSTEANIDQINTSTNVAVVASSKGTKYHYPNCPGARTISEKNKISFASVAMAESAGYTLALNCKPK
ncbi:MAG: hypothetical protein AB200_00770 [Parcubacteria bacterium C7867-005]|nr:MAG: hypothetical protein AB200_00770 [Parcubacteria bacterium C7867-005]